MANISINKVVSILKEIREVVSQIDIYDDFWDNVDYYRELHLVIGEDGYNVRDNNGDTVYSNTSINNVYKFLLGKKEELEDFTIIPKYILNDYSCRITSEGVAVGCNFISYKEFDDFCKFVNANRKDKKKVVAKKVNTKKQIKFN